MNKDDPYAGRHQRAKTVKRILRESTGGRTPRPTKGSGIGDVRDGYLRGFAGGEAYEHFDNKPKRR